MNTNTLKELLARVNIEDAQIEITLVEHSDDPVFSLPDEMKENPRYAVTDWAAGLTEANPFYRICMTVYTSPNSDFQMEVWLPEISWNERTITVGNSGSAMTVNHLALLGGILDDFAVFHCNLSTGGDLDRGINNPEIWKDFGWRATHLTTKIGCQIVELFYDQAPDYRYFYGCSTGGQQGISAAERFPSDYHGIVAVAPAFSRVHLHLYFLWNVQQLMRPDGSFVFSSDEVKKLSELTIGYFQSIGDGQPGDQFVTNPRLTEEQRTELFERIRDAAFLSEDQLERLWKVYTGPVDPETGERLYCGFAPGAELGFFGLNAVKIPGYTYEYLYPARWICGKSFAEFDIFDCDVFAVADSDTAKSVAGELNTDSGDLSAFKKTGGKLLMTSGAMDAVVPEPNITNYYERVVKAQGDETQTQDFFRYFMIPGFSHSIKGGRAGIDYIGHKCGRLPVSAQYVPVAYYDASLVYAIIDWVESGVAPDALMVTAFQQMHVPGELVPDIRQGIRFQRQIKPYSVDGLTSPEPRGERYWCYE